jgi:glycosyltransferase involved in cell wall biosynthesis
MRILIVCTHPMLLQSSGSTRRLEFYLDALSAGSQITLLAPSALRSTSNSITNRYKTYYFKTFRIGQRESWFVSDCNPLFCIQLCRVVKKERIDLIQIHMPWGIISAVILSRKPVVYVSHAVESDSVKVVVSSIRTPLSQMVYCYSLLMEFLATRLATLITCTSDADRMRFIEKYNVKPSKLHTIPIGIRMENKDLSKTKEFMKLRTDQNKTAIFLGSYYHHPNRRAIDLITDYIAPRVWKIDDRIRFLIAGNEVPKFAQKNVRGLGFVKDLKQLLISADLGVCPVLDGPGVRIKVLDFAKFGVPIVATEAAMRGLEFKNMEHAIITKNVDEDFVQAIVDLANDNDERRRLSTNAYQLIRERYSFENLSLKLINLYQATVAGTRGTLRFN